MVSGATKVAPVWATPHLIDMKQFSSFLTERTGEKAHKEAEQLGLKYKGFGYWVDPRSGQVTHKTEGDNLIPVEPDVETEKWSGDPEAASGGAGGAMAPGAPPMPAPGAGQDIGTAEPGLEQAPKRMSWEPGPDGDTCVDPAQPKPEIEKDVFVGKTNYSQWTAGADGTNFTNATTFDQYSKVAMEHLVVEEEEVDSARRPADKYTQPNLGKEVSYGDSAGKMVKRMVQPGREPKGRTEREARGALDRMPPRLRSAQVQSLINMKNDPPLKGQDPEAAEQGKRADVWRKAAKLPAIAKDADATAEMNQAAAPLFSDPLFDLDQYDDEDFIDGGAFGQVAIDGDKVIKRGRIGPDEMKALYAMRDHPGFPTLINGRFDGPFKHQSAYENNPMNADNERRDSEGNYWDPDQASDFDDMYPTAPGTYAMTRAKGRPLADEIDYMDEEQQEAMADEFWQIRQALHEAGFSHNDMHGGNIFVDDEGHPSIIDLGLAKDDPLSALMEALGGADYEQGNDYQLSSGVGGAATPLRIQEIFNKNMGTVRDKIQAAFSDDPSTYDDYDDEIGYSPTYQGLADDLNDLMGGDIRMKRERLEQLRESFPMLRDREAVLGLIRALYKGVKPNELEQRMSNAFDKRQADSKIIRTANAIRKLNGEPPIEVKNKAVVPPQNLDFDD